MWYVIIGRDAADSLEKRARVRTEHLARLTALGQEGRLLTAGPLPRIDAPDPGPDGFAGSLVIAEFSSLEQANTWAEADPYIQEGAWREVEVHPFKAVLP